MAFLLHVYNHHLSFKNLTSSSSFYLIWPVWSQAEAVGEGMKNVGLSPNCISRVYTFEEEVVVSQSVTFKSVLLLHMK